MDEFSISNCKESDLDELLIMAMKLFKDSNELELKGLLTGSLKSKNMDCQRSKF
ncbi:MAG: hypothetical protein RH860_05065 [Cytophagales bacterium]